MLNDGGSFSKVILAVGYTDLRRGIEGLASIVKFKYNLDPHEKNVPWSESLPAECKKKK